MKSVAYVTEKINSTLMAKGKFRGSNGNKALSYSNGTYKGAEVFTTEFDINETPPSARTLLTKGYIQDEINSFSGTTVSTRGRYMTEQEKTRCPNERPLYLYIQGHSKNNIDLAIQKINEIIKTEYQSSLNRPSRFTNAPPPLMSLHTGVPSVEKICIGIENAPQSFDLRGRIIGTGGANLLYIRGETGANVTLRGRGSQFVDPSLGTESPEPLHLYIEHPKSEALQNAKQLAINLIQTMQSEFQSFIQQQLPPIQPQQVLENRPIQQIQQTHFQTMNIGALTQSNVVTIQHQDIIQHAQSSVVTLPATILTATMTGGPAPGANVPPPPGVHIPAHSGPLVPSSQSQEMQALISSAPSVGQVQLIGPPPTVSEVQYQIHPSQPVHIQGIQMPSVSHSSTPSIAQMYVMSHPPPQSPSQHGFIASNSGPVSGAVSYVYTQPNIQRSVTPIETVNLQQPPPTHQPPPPLLHLHFPPPNFSANQPPPPIPQTYQIQYQQAGPQSQTQFILQSEESNQLQQNSEHAQHILPPQFEGQPPPHHQYPLHIPPPSTQTFIVPNSHSPSHQPHPSHHHHHHHHPHSHPHPHPHPHAHHHHHHHHHRQQGSFIMGVEGQHEGAIDQGPPQPVPPPPQMVPPPTVNQLPNPINILTTMPPPNQQPPQQNAPWLYQAQQPPPHQGQIQVQAPPPQGFHHAPPSQVQSHIQYHTHQLQCQNGHIPTQVHYTIQPPPQPFEMHKPDSPEHHKGHGVKRRFTDVEGLQEAVPYQCGPPPVQRHGNGKSYDDKQHLDQPGSNLENDQTYAGDCGSGQPIPPPAAPWQSHHVRVPWSRPPPPPPPPPSAPREGEQHMLYPVPPLPTNMPPPQIRPRGQNQQQQQQDADRTRSPVQGVTLEHHMNVEHNQLPPYSTKSPYNSLLLTQSVCNAPPPPPPLPPPPPPSSHHHQRPQYQLASQGHQPPAACPPWMN
ncbi:Similar to khdc4: KH homology domain-containing protein 4 (Xenopus laevis) [Cotesia congregata]|uniref:KH homology domain-containing protein 4 n=1 Tax=Cotesia congregata TaxID=51543 RepID=A0A8J2MW50_COTCN|nr:Similar to khdc4: KH homology domain-containing protein 4 (Xenopus laevis) [Cotesia congregata]